MIPGRLLTALLLLSSLSSSQSLFTLRENGEAPSRTYHVVHYKIDITLDLEKKSVTGNVATTIVPFMSDFKTVVFDAEKMTVARVTLGSKELRFDMDEKKLSIHLDKSYTSQDTLTLVSEYSCTPKEGMFWSQPDSAYPKRHWQVWSQGEDMTNHFWFPCYDFPNDKSTSEVVVTVDRKFTTLSNGKLITVKENKTAGTRTYHWKESKPHASYLIMVAAGEYTVLKDRAGKLPLEYYVYPEDTLNARICFKETPDMVAFFNEKFGFTYPWEKYGQIILQDHFGGMENTSATTLSDVSTVYDARERLDDSPVGLIAHELAHQWWGDVVTAKDWRHLWLNESFATYFEPLYRDHLLGHDEFLIEMYGNQQAGVYVDTTRGRRPVVSVDSYGENVYPRGASILHMLRFVLGDELFWRGINHYITKHQFRPVETNDFKIALEEVTGQNLYWFFDEWLYKAGHPVFDVSYRWSDSAKAIFLSIRQSQTMDSLTGIFRMPVDIEVTAAGATVTHRINLVSKDTIATLPCSTKPELVIFDRGSWIMKELKFEKSPEEWVVQATTASNPVDRILALRALGALPNNERFAPVFLARMKEDAFWNVRTESIVQTGKIASADSALKSQITYVLLALARDAKSAIRGAALSLLGKYKGNDVVTALRAALNDSSYYVIASALRSLAKADSANAAVTFKAYLDYPSHREQVSTTALRALASVDSSQAVDAALLKVRYGEPTEMRYTALGILGRYGKGRTDVLSLSTSLLNDRNEGLRSAAARTLGNIGDETVIPSLEKIANDKDNPASDAAKGSIEKIRKKREENKTGEKK